MKVVVSKDYDSGKPRSILPLVPAENEDPAAPKESLRTFELYSNPADNTSVKYKSTIRVLYGTESLRTTIKWRKDVTRIHIGMATPTAAAKVLITRELLRGTALTNFETYLASEASQIRNIAALAAAEASRVAGNDAAAQEAAAAAVHATALDTHYDDACLNKGYDGVIDNIAPVKVLTKIKNDLRRHTRKPKGMTIREFYVRLLHINQEEIPYLSSQNGIAPRPLVDDELTDIIVNAVPRSWIREMDRQGRDPDCMLSGNVVAFLEQIETAEEFVPDKHQQSNDKGKKTQKFSGNKNNNSGGGQKYCALHGKGSHTTDECNTIKSQVKKMKSSNYSPGGNKPSGNKTWSKKAEDYKKKSQKDLNTMGKVVAKLKKEVNSLSKKRKSDDSADEAELHAIEMELNALDMGGFDIENIKKDMEAAKKNDDDGSVSV